MEKSNSDMMLRKIVIIVLQGINYHIVLKDLKSVGISEGVFFILRKII